MNVTAVPIKPFLWTFGLLALQKEVEKNEKKLEGGRKGLDINKINKRKKQCISPVR